MAKPSIAEQIAAVEQHLGVMRAQTRGFAGGHYPNIERDIAAYEAILATLSQHEALVQAARELVESARAMRPSINSAIVALVPLLALKSHVAALDAAETQPVK